MKRSGGEFGSGQGDGRPQKKSLEPTRQIPQVKKESKEDEPKIFEKFGQDYQEPQDPDKGILKGETLISLSEYLQKKEEDRRGFKIIPGEVIRRTDEETTQEQSIGITLGDVRRRESEEQSYELPAIENPTEEDFWRYVADRLAPPETHDDIREGRDLSSTPRLDFTSEEGPYFDLGIGDDEKEPVQSPSDADVTPDEAFGPAYWAEVDNGNRSKPDAMQRLSDYHRSQGNQERRDPAEAIIRRIIQVETDPTENEH